MLLHEYGHCSNIYWFMFYIVSKLLYLFSTLLGADILAKFSALLDYYSGSIPPGI